MRHQGSHFRGIFGDPLVPPLVEIVLRSRLQGRQMPVAGFLDELLRSATLRAGRLADALLELWGECDGHGIWGELASGRPRGLDESQEDSSIIRRCGWRGWGLRCAAGL